MRANNECLRRPAFDSCVWYPLHFQILLESMINIKLSSKILIKMLIMMEILDENALIFPRFFSISQVLNQDPLIKLIHLSI